VQVLNDFPWYEDLDEIWRDNPAYAAKTFSSAPGTDRAGGLKALTQQKSKGKGKASPPPAPDHTEDSMIVVDDAPNTRDDALNPLEDHPPANPLEDRPPAYPLEDRPPANPLEDCPPANPLEDRPPANPLEGHPLTNPLCNVDLPYDTTDPVIDDFAMGDELDYDENEDVEHEEAPRSLSNKRPLSSPSPPPTHTRNHSSYGTFKSHVSRVMGHGPIRSPKSPSSIASLSMKAVTRSTSSGFSSPSSSSRQLSTTLKDSTAKKSLGKNIGSEVGSVRGQVEALTNNMSYVYTAKAAASEYKIAKVNALRQERDLDFQREKADLERNEAIVIHQRCQESKILELQVLEAQAKVHAERKATLQLEIELIKLKGGAAD
jgi:hypothetical protein